MATSFSSNPQVQAWSIMRGTSAQITALIAAGLVVNRLYQNTTDGTIRMALTSSTLSDPLVFGSNDVDQLATRVTDLEGNRVLTTDFQTYQQTVTDALGGKVDTSAFTTYQQSVTDALNGKLGATAKAVDSDKLDGKTYAQVSAAWTSDIAAREAVLTQAIAQGVRSVRSVNLANGSSTAFGSLAAFGSLSDGVHAIVINMGANDEATVTSYPGSDADPSHVASNNDMYYVTVASGSVSSVARRNDITNVLVAALNTSVQEVGNRVTTIEGFTYSNGMNKNGSDIKLGGNLTASTAIGGEFDLEFNLRTIHKVLIVQDLSDPVKYYRIGIANDEVVYGEVPYSPLA